MRVLNNFERNKYMKNRWDWVVFVEESPEDLLKIKDVKNITYYLHKSALNDVRFSQDKLNKFQLFGGGWGEFLIGAELKTEEASRIEDGYSKFYHALYWLDLGFAHTKEEKKEYLGFFEKGRLPEKMIEYIRS